MTLAARTPMTLQEAPSLILSGQEATVPTAPQSVHLAAVAESAATGGETFITAAEGAAAATTTATAPAIPAPAATTAIAAARGAPLAPLAPPPIAATTQATPLGLSTPSPMAASLPMLGALLLVVGLILGLGKLVQKMQKARASKGAAALQVRGGVALSQRERLVWVQAGEKHLLLGVSPGSVQTLHVFDQSLDGETLAAAAATATTPVGAARTITEPAATEATASQDFAHRLQTMLEAARSKAAAKTEAPAKTEPKTATKAPSLFSFHA